MNVGLMSITASAAIVPSFTPSRTTGIAPLAVFFDATSTTTNTTARPFHELDYAWDFGDTGTGNWAYGSSNSVLTPGGGMGGQTDYSGVAASLPTATKSKNKAYGPCAAHVFETAGTYTITLTVTNGTITQTTTQTVTVYSPTDPTNGYSTVYVFSATGNFTGAPAGTQVTTSSWDSSSGSVLFNTNGSSRLGPGVQLLLKQGDTYTCSTNSPTISPTGPWDISSWGSGAQPIITAQSTGGPIITAAQNSTDGRIRNLQFDGTGAANSSMFNLGYSTSQILLFNVTGTNLGSGIAWGGQNGPGTGTSAPDQIFFVNPSIQSITASTGACFFGNSVTRVALMGADFENTTAGVYVARWQTYSKMVTQHCLSVRGAAGFACFNFHGPTYNKSTLTSGLGVVSDNVFVTDTSQSQIMDCDPQAPGQAEMIQDVIFERNMLVGSASTSQACIVEATNITFRNNIYLNSRRTGNVQAQLVSLQSNGSVPAPTNVWLYNNTVYYPNISGLSASAAVVNNPIAAGVIIMSDNLIYAVSGGSGSHYIIGSGTATTTGSTNNTPDADITVSPGFTNGSGSFIQPSDFTPAGSYAVGGGASVPSFYDIFRVAWSGAYDIGAVHH